MYSVQRKVTIMLHSSLIKEWSASKNSVKRISCCVFNVKA